ncbi:MAG: hypothetical protein WBX00_33950, partial [Isosphaeraceae bacterium]
MHGTTAGQVLCLGFRGAIAGLLAAWIFAQAPADARGSVDFLETDAAPGGPVTPAALGFGQAQAADRQGDKTSSTSSSPAPVAGAEHEKKPDTTTVASSSLEAFESILKDLLAYDAATLTKDSQRNAKLEEFAKKRGMQFLSMNHPDATLSQADWGLLYKIIYHLDSQPGRPTASAA